MFAHTLVKSIVITWLLLPTKHIIVPVAAIWASEGFFPGRPIVKFFQGSSQKDFPRRSQKWWNFSLPTL